ncbi:hypothetical protein [Hoylesella loescheii]|uniref:hypothetical protein n=1 Tax=Hoylesella loescheii TaxID=840 RepID=UPI00248E1B12|nr:hypothetical protein [Hoylesella loescheii]
MKEKQLKDYEAHLRKMGEMAKEIGIEFTYLDNSGAIIVSEGDPSILESLITANMYRQDVFAKAILNAVQFFFSHQEDMSDCVSKMREQDALNEAKSAVDNLLRDNGFK